MQKALALLLILAAGLVTGCSNGVNFNELSSDKNDGLQVPIVVTPPPPVVVDPPPPTTLPEPQPDPEDPEVSIPPTLIMKAGTCPVGSPEKVLSCLDCQSEAATPPPPILSRKAQELLDIMTAACSVPNKSDPVGYVPPTREQILKRLIQCSPTAYPDTAFESTQKVTVQNLLSNAVAQQSAFGGLYYNWATTDFSTYFGLDIGEARYTMCRGQATFNMGGTYPKEYYDSLYSEGSSHYELPGIWKRAQPIRENLRNCMYESLRNPNVNQGEPIPGKSCRYETAEGEMSSLVVRQANKWISEGHAVYFEGFNMCGQVEYPENLIDRVGRIKLAVKICD